MTREELIDHWAEDIIPAVFKAEDKLRNQLKKVIEKHMDDPTTARELYTHMIAKEIINNVPDEQISQM